eukprot:CAMPEP_0198682528 /NCGR_PEP_ID=MMETSP1468-20131203/8875_1 /TAXON_ID=1461545 /ORGANISM="Mantoniella sp, Strain CCMP1436" /LENGTH=294 /DNA_ID=CAMNT_0044425577 /DNA_START=720 /DNA_END=1608 /DNA_ORIENTATION=-
MVDGMLHIGSAAIVPPQPPMPPNVTPSQARHIAMQAHAQAAATANTGGGSDMMANLPWNSGGMGAVSAGMTGGVGGGMQVPPHQHHTPPPAAAAAAAAAQYAVRQRQYGQSQVSQYSQQQVQYGQQPLPPDRHNNAFMAAGNSGGSSNGGWPTGRYNGTTYFPTAATNYGHSPVNGTSTYYPYQQQQQGMDQMAVMQSMQYWQQCLDYYNMGGNTNYGGGNGVDAGAFGSGGLSAMETSSMSSTPAMGDKHIISEPNQSAGGMINADDDNTGAMKTTMTADCAPTAAVLYDDAR